MRELNVEAGGIEMNLREFRSGHMTLLTRYACRSGGHACTGPGSWFPGPNAVVHGDLVHTLPQGGNCAEDTDLAAGAYRCAYGRWVHIDVQVVVVSCAFFVGCKGGGICAEDTD